MREAAPSASSTRTSRRTLFPPVRRLTALAACVFLTACSTLAELEIDPGDVRPLHYSVSENLHDEVDSLVQPLIAGGQTPGMIVGVLLPDGSRQFFGYGTIDAPGDGKPDADTLFAIGSLSKGFLGALTALLVDEGMLEWNDTLGDLLPPATPLSDSARKITLLQLATHTAGLPRQVFNNTTLRQFVRYLFTGESFYRQFDRDFVLGYLADFEAGAANPPNYSNIGYGLLGYLLELRSGLSIDELLKRRLNVPLGLQCTGYTAGELPCYPARAHGHAGDQPKFIRRGTTVPDWEFTDFMRGSAGLHSTARDLLSFAAAHLTDKQSRFGAALADTLRVRFERPKEAAAVAWMADDIDGQRINHQIGLVAGYSSYIGIDAQRKMAVVVMQNSFNWNNNAGHRLLLRLAHELRTTPFKDGNSAAEEASAR